MAQLSDRLQRLAPSATLAMSQKSSEMKAQGLDIINNLCKHYDVYAPIVVDNSESNLNILDTDSQQIRLEVHDSELQII